MKKIYDTPEMLVMMLRSEDIMTASPIMAHEEGGNGDFDFFMFPE